MITRDRRQKRRQPDADRPTIGELRIKAITEWLAGHNARSLSCHRIGRSADGSARLMEFFSVNGRPLAVQWLGGQEWEIWLPASESNSITETLRAASKALGLEYQPADQVPLVTPEKAREVK